MLDIRLFLVGTFLLLSPLCLIAGAFFSLLVRLSASDGAVSPAGGVYMWEAAGSLLGGALFGPFLFDLIQSQDTLFLLSAIAGVAGISVALSHRIKSAALLMGAGLGLLLFARFGLDLDAAALALRYPGHAILEQKETPYGMLTATQLGGQVTVFLNHVPLFVTGDVAGVEENVHFSCVQRPVSPKILIVGGNPAELVVETQKYSGSYLDCLEENRWLRELERRLLPLQDTSRAHVVGSDPREFARSTTRRYDVVILMASDPSTIQSNRLYTVEAARMFRGIMTPTGVLSLSLPSSEEYAGSDSRRVRAILRTTLAQVFRHVLVLPAQRDHFLASDSTLRGGIAAAIDASSISTVYVNGNYLQDDLMLERSHRLESLLTVSAEINTDGHPVLMLAQIRYWLGFFSFSAWLPLLIGLAVVSLVLFRSDRISAGVMTAGCSGLILELIALMMVQVSFGNVYKMIGGMVAVFMAGMSVGALLGQRIRISRRFYVVLQFGLAVAILSSSALQSVTSGSATSMTIALLVCLGGGAVAAGALFSLSSRLSAGTGTGDGSRLYAADLLGSALGALLVGPYLLPVFGIRVMALSTTALVIIGAVISLTSPAWHPQSRPLEGTIL
jgi:spermidine synthase